MRHILLLTASISAFALAGCSVFSPEKPDAAEPASASAAQDIKASDAEANEMSSVMGEGEATPDATSEPSTASSADGPPEDCPSVEVLPDTRSITYFDDPEGKANGKMIASASLVDIRGGCDYAPNGVSVDIDMIMKGKITHRGRYEGRDDLEAFMTFPYFVAIMGPDGKLIDKKIMATAMRFKPKVDDLDHAEKITQTIPLPDITQGPKYTITIGFQLNRAQLDYNRGGAALNKDKKPEDKPKDKPKKETKPAAAAKVKAEAETGDDGAITDAAPEAAAPTPAPARPAAGSSPSKMQPIVE